VAYRSHELRETRYVDDACPHDSVFAIDFPVRAPLHCSDCFDSECCGLYVRIMTAIARNVRYESLANEFR